MTGDAKPTAAARRMRSQIRFVMHPDDEHALAAMLLEEPALLFVDGPRWPTRTPVTSRSLADVRGYAILWSPEDLATLDADYIATCDDWYCRSEHSTIQFLRSTLRDDAITEGRFAVGTLAARPEAAASVERRFKRIQRFLKATYTNRVVVSKRAPDAPPLERPVPESRLAPVADVWVGPAAMAWFLADPSREVRIRGSEGRQEWIRTVRVA